MRSVRLLLLAGLSGALLASSAQAVPVTIGSPLTASFSSAPQGNPITIANPSLSEPGAIVSSPVDGTVVRWRIEDATGGPFKLRVLKPVSGTTYTGAGTSYPQSPSSLATQVFPTNLPIRTGQILGLDNALGTDQIGRASVSGPGFEAWNPPLADGATQAGSVGGAFEFAFNADVQPYPSVSAVSPASGPATGGTTVTISGSNLDGTTAVSFGSAPAASFAVVSPSMIAAVSPASSGGTVDITVKNPGVSPVVAADRFTFVASPVVIKCAVPKLKGKKVKAAKKALANANCKLGKVKKHGHKKGKVKKQSPKAGTVLAAGSKVGVTLGK